MIARLACILALFTASPGGVAAAQPELAPALATDGLTRGPEAGVGSIIDGDTLMLEDGSEVRLVGIQAPKLPLDRPDFVAWPLAGAATDGLRDIALGARVRLFYGGRRSDRYGRHLAQLRRQDGLWLQGEMLRLGLARVYSFADNPAAVPEMLAIESGARRRGDGIWSHSYYAVREHRDAESFIGSFQLVEGTVYDVARIGGRTYINFGPDWRTDFTVNIPNAARRRFEKAGFDLPALEGKRVRVRGWIERWNGPMIEASHPGQIEVLSDVVAVGAHERITNR